MRWYLNGAGGIIGFTEEELKPMNDMWKTLNLPQNEYFNFMSWYFGTQIVGARPDIMDQVIDIISEPEPHSEEYWDKVINENEINVCI